MYILSHIKHRPHASYAEASQLGDQPSQRLRHTVLLPGVWPRAHHYQNKNPQTSGILFTGAVETPVFSVLLLTKNLHSAEVTINNFPWCLLPRTTSVVIDSPSLCPPKRPNITKWGEYNLRLSSLLHRIGLELAPPALSLWIASQFKMLASLNSSIPLQKGSSWTPGLFQIDF